MTIFHTNNTKKLKFSFTTDIAKDYYDHMQELSFLRSIKNKKRVIVSTLIIEALEEMFPDFKDCEIE